MKLKKPQILFNRKLLAYPIKQLLENPASAKAKYKPMF
jgi:hypothetical protein